ncbi:MAG TPA: lipoyl(octanoyl) transferase LipB [Phycisphaerales bacterium]|nr:lipoyl(octanoyl) transferase LipB [Phycisphaerales bacterium]
MPCLRHIDLGSLGYREAYDLQCLHLEEVLAARAAGTPEWGRVLLVEHDPVITISGRKGAEANLIASPDTLARAGVSVERTDRGGDITYHGPGQLVAYPILDLNALGLNLHGYMRLLEQAVIDTCAAFGVEGRRDPGATGVWVEHEGVTAKVAAMGVRVRRWISMHGLAVNVTTDLRHFQLIVPCGLAGRPVTSLAQILGDRCPAMGDAKAELTSALDRLVMQAAATAEAHRRARGECGEGAELARRAQNFTE